MEEGSKGMEICISCIIKFIESKMKKWWEFIVPVAFLSLYLLLGGFIIDGFFVTNVSDSHLSVAITITTTVFIGGCLLLLVENQHIEGEIVSRYHSVMRPFYHRFTLFVKVINKFVLTISPKDEEGRKIRKNIKTMAEGPCRIAFQSIVSGNEPHYMEAKKIDALCGQINNIWYYFDRNYSAYNHIALNDTMGNLKALVTEYEHSAMDGELLHRIPILCGDFYCKEWQPIQNVPYNYEYFMKQAEICNRYIYVCMAIAAVCIISLLFGDSYGCLPLWLCDSLVLVALSSFLVCLYKFQKLKIRSIIAAF